MKLIKFFFLGSLFIFVSNINLMAQDKMLYQKDQIDELQYKLDNVQNRLFNYICLCGMVNDSCKPCLPTQISPQSRHDAVYHEVDFRNIVIIIKGIADEIILYLSDLKEKAGRLEVLEKKINLLNDIALETWNKNSVILNNKKKKK